ncbi:TRANSLATION MACHINERY-ASSOCIATED PROTEIN 22 [Salix viminalis]|uniref:TRANSLATION MACHINERY-ASSOCIATED PROTEIN 22 n=1 Tax=Salix viminalis TaxID=40686 RepID=A0A9Q0NQX3_SALVM|nr:TRANSLATION MACHINERY-ASSOCIATED PROTEIN 22 [Salix viminalis]
MSIVNSGLISRNASLGSSKTPLNSILIFLKRLTKRRLRGFAEQLHSVGISSFGADGAVSSVQSGETSSYKQEEVKRLPGGKIKKKVRQEVGLDLFGIKLSDASKKLGKKFATGASVVKGPTEKEQIDVQGDIAYDIVEFITETWPDVPETAIYFIEEGKKVPAA